MIGTQSHEPSLLPCRVCVSWLLEAELGTELRCSDVGFTSASWAECLLVPFPRVFGSSPLQEARSLIFWCNHRKTCGVVSITWEEEAWGHPSSPAGEHGANGDRTAWFQCMFEGLN